MQLYQSIESCLQDQAPLDQAMSTLYASLLPKRKFRSHGLTQQQHLYLVYQHMRAPLNKLKQRIDNQIKQSEQVSSSNLSQQEISQQQANSQQKDLHHIQDQLNNEIDEGNEELGEEADEENIQLQGYSQNKEEQALLNDGDQLISDEDVGLYGEQIDEEDMESYENQNMGDDPEFGNFNLNKPSNHQPKKQDDGQDDFVEDNFDQFRQIQMENAHPPKQQQPTQLQQQIQRLEDRAMKGKNWVLGGEIKAKQRPVNSLLDTQLEFKSGIKYSHQINENYNNSLQAIIKQRILDQIFDDRVRYIPNAGFGRRNKLQDVSTDKSSKGLAELYEIQFKNSLGLGQNKNQKLKKQIMDSFKQLNYFLDSLSNTGFALKPVAKFQKNGAEAIVLEDKVPVTNWSGQMGTPNAKHNFESEKQVNRKTKRLRNKRNARQRKKQQDKKKSNRAIQYGGITKYEAQARKKIAKTKLNVKQVKFSKSNSFFKSINNKDRPGKPNANLSKIKI